MSRIGYIQSDLDLKFLVLYIMAHVVSPITFDQLLSLSLCDEGVDYFGVNQAVLDLIHTEHLTLRDSLYSITEKGRRNSDICQSSLPFSVRRRCDENLAAVNAKLRRDAQVQAVILPQENEMFTVRLQLDDDSGSLMRVELLLPSREQAQALADRFREQPEQVYSAVISALLPPCDGQ